MKAIIYCALSACLVLSMGCGRNNSTDSKEMAEDENKEKFDNADDQNDTDFAIAAADGGMLEVKLGELAVKNANSSQVREFGQQMITDHGREMLSSKHWRSRRA